MIILFLQTYYCVACRLFGVGMSNMADHVLQFHVHRNEHGEYHCRVPYCGHLADNFNSCVSHFQEEHIGFMFECNLCHTVRFDEVG